MALLIDIVTSGTRGLLRDAEIAAGILSSKYRTQINISRQRNAHLLHRRLLKGLANRLTRPDRVLLFFEILPSSWMGLADTRILVPNQEWMREEVVRNLPKCTQIWCKTYYAESIFRHRGFDARYIGFSSRDVYLPQVAKDYGRFIHVAGRSHLKGTRTILELWRRHPEWPSLLVITSNTEWNRYAAPNLALRVNNLPERELHALMNQCGIHLCPSETEGYGHYISEALSAKALVITVAAPPMNELVAPGQGLLAKYHKIEPMSFSERFFVDAGDLERQIETAVQMSEHEKALTGEAARTIYLERHAAFAATFLAAAGELTRR